MRHVLKHEKIRFALVGVVNTAVDFVIFLTLSTIFGLPVLAANIISTSCALAVSYLLNKKAVFGDTDPSNRRQIFLFIAVTLFGLWVIQVAIIMVMSGILQTLLPHAVVAVTLTIAKLIATVASLVWNYLWYSRVVFAKQQTFSIDGIMDNLVKHWKAVVVSASIVTLILTMTMGIGRSVWFDEGYSIMLAQRPIPEMIELTKVDAHPPLYYLYLKAWGTLFGWTELSLRLSSAIPIAISVGVMLLILRRLFSSKIAIAVAPFLVLAPFLARYGYEIRMYGLVVLIGTVGTWLLLKARDTNKPIWWIGYAAVVALGMYTLYMSIVIWLAHAIWLVYDDLRHKKSNPILKKHWLYYLLAVTLFLFWLPSVLYQLDNSALPPYMTRLDLQAFGNTMSLLLSYTAIWDAMPWLVAAVITAGVLLVWLLVRIRQKIDRKQWSGVVLLLLTVVIALFFYWYISSPPSPPRYTDRYMVHVAPFLYALIGVVICLGYKVGQRWQAISLGVLSLGLFVYGLSSLYTVGNYNYQRLQPVYAKTVKQQVGCDQTTFVTSGAYGYIDMWYDFQGCDFRYFQPVDLTYVGGYAPINKINTTKRVKGIQDVDAKRMAFIYYDDSTEFMHIDSRYKLERQLDLAGGVHVQIYQRDL